MTRKRRMKILIGSGDELIAEHARKLIRNLEKRETTHPDYVMPRGVAAYSAQFPITCDECGQTYWARDQYAPHLGCRGYRPHQTGFAKGGDTRT